MLSITTGDIQQRFSINSFCGIVRTILQKIYVNLWVTFTSTVLCDYCIKFVNIAIAHHLFSWLFCDNSKYVVPIAFMASFTRTMQIKVMILSS